MPKKMTTRSKQRIAIFDIESVSLDADWGWCVCISAKIYGEKKIYTFSTLQDRKPGKKWNWHDDKNVMKRWAKFVASVDCLVAHYGDKFDKPYLNSRMLFHHLPPIPNIQTIDTWRVPRFRMKLKRNTLANVADFLGIPIQKTPLEYKIWRDAKLGDLKATKYIIEHCEQDVLVLEQVYERLRPLIYNHPATDENFPVHAPGRGRFFEMTCPTCGATGGLISHGRRITQGGKYVAQRLTCTKCGSYCHTKKRNVNTTDLSPKP